MDDKYIRPKEACELLGISTRTLYTWSTEGKLKYEKTKGGQRRYLRRSVLSLSEDTPQPGDRVCYARVSTISQKKDLGRQIELLRSKYPDHEIVSDIGSGLNFKRKGFNSLLDRCIRGDIQEIVVTHKDRLCRFGFDLFERLLKENSNGNIVVLDEGDTTPEKELINDLIAIITVFSARVHGLRAWKYRKSLKELRDAENPEDENVPNTGGEETTPTSDVTV